MQSLRARKELEYSPTLQTLDTYAANPVAINRYQYVRLLPARVVSVISTNFVCHLLIILPRVCAWPLKICFRRDLLCHELFFVLNYRFRSHPCATLNEGPIENFVGFLGCWVVV